MHAAETDRHRVAVVLKLELYFPIWHPSNVPRLGLTRLDWTQLVVKQSNVRETCMGNSTITALHFDSIFFSN